MEQHHKHTTALRPLILLAFMAGTVMLASPMPSGALAQEGLAHADEAPKPLRIAVAYAPKTLDPALATDAAAARLLQLTNPALLKVEKGVPQPLVATSCTLNQLNATCLLPNSKTFSDGTALTAPQLAGWFNYLKANTRSPLNGALSNVASIKAEGPTKLTFQLNQPNLGFLSTLADIPLAPTPPNPEATGQRPGLGSYQITAADALGNVTLTKLSSTTPGPAALQFLYVQDATTRLLKLKQGEVDLLLNDIPPELYTWATKQGFPAAMQRSSSYSYLVVNFKHPQLSNLLVRQAINGSINRRDIRRYLLGYLAAPADSLLPPGHPAAWPAPEPAMLDVFQAEDLLNAADTFGDELNPRFSLTLLTSTDALSQRVAQVLQQQLRKIGIDLKLQPLEFGAFYDNVKQGRFDLALMSWSGEQQPDFLYRVFNQTQFPPAGLNRGRVNLPELNTATQAIISATTLASQTEAAITTQQLQSQLLPYIPLYRRHHVLLARPGVTDCSIPTSGGYQGLLNCKVQP